MLVSHVFATPGSVTSPSMFGIGKTGQLHSRLFFREGNWGCWTRQGAGQQWGPLGRPGCGWPPPRTKAGGGSQQGRGTAFSQQGKTALPPSPSSGPTAPRPLDHQAAPARPVWESKHALLRQLPGPPASVARARSSGNLTLRQRSGC